MEETRLLIPVLGMLVLTMTVWVFMYVRRIGYMVANKIPAHAGRTPERMKQLIPEEISYPSHNLQNLFELPVAFYAICGYLVWAGQSDSLHIVCAFVFFVSRALHSLIHCTFNHVLMRFGAYIIGAIALWVMVVRAAIAL